MPGLVGTGGCCIARDAIMLGMGVVKIEGCKCVGMLGIANDVYGESRDSGSDVGLLHNTELPHVWAFFCARHS